MSFGKTGNTVDDARLGEEAAEWLLRLEDPDSDDEYPDEKSRNATFLEWIKTSENHLRVFFETVELHRRMGSIDSKRLIDVASLLQQGADVISLHPPEVHRRTEPKIQQRRTLSNWVLGIRSQVTRRGSHRFQIATLLLCAIAAGTYWAFDPTLAYATGIGEQRSLKLADGSFIYLNTDSKVEVRFARSARNIRLLRGEALFIVERDSARPFIVTTGDATARALGTQFNVRRRDEGAEIAVVEGTVQVSAIDGQVDSSAQKLRAGEGIKVLKGQLSRPVRQSVSNILAWRQRRLIFHDARLADVAAEFNRYNRTRIIIADDRAKEIMLSGIFDADRPQALVLYAAARAEFSVEPIGSDWVIRGH